MEKFKIDRWTLVDKKTGKCILFEGVPFLANTRSEAREVIEPGESVKKVSVEMIVRSE